MALVFLCLGTACSAPKETFTVQVVNNTPVALSAGLIKNGPSDESQWDSPERIAIQAPQLSDRKWGTLIPPGQTRTLTQTGRFTKGDLALLRVYAGDMTIGELIAYGRNDPARVDIYLWPGPAGYAIEMHGQKLSSKRLEERR